MAPSPQRIKQPVNDSPEIVSSSCLNDACHTARLKFTNPGFPDSASSPGTYNAQTHRH